MAPKSHGAMFSHLLGRRHLHLLRSLNVPFTRGRCRPRIVLVTRQRDIFHAKNGQDRKSCSNDGDEDEDPEDGDIRVVDGGSLHGAQRETLRQWQRVHDGEGLVLQRQGQLLSEPLWQQRWRVKSVRALWMASHSHTESPQLTRPHCATDGTADRASNVCGDEVQGQNNGMV